jgi:RluA family pseudouridine synthase
MKNGFGGSRQRGLQGIELIFEDRDLLVIVKPVGLLSNSPHRDEERTAERILTTYLCKGSVHSRLKVYTVHRLDRETSGLMVFAKSERVQQQLQDRWSDNDKIYAAVVHGRLKDKAGSLVDVLAENAAQVVYVSRNPSMGKRAELNYTVIRETAAYSLLDVRLITGRKNQIRVQFAHRGHPVVGDPKYGLKGDNVARMALHARHLAFNHPYNGRRMLFDAPVPHALLSLVG